MVGIIMRCLVIGLHDRVGGVERYFENYFPYLIKNGIQCDFVSPYKKLAFEDTFRGYGSHIYTIPNFKRNPIGYFLFLCSIIRQKKYSVIYINLLSAANILPVICSGLFQHGRIIVHSHNNGVPRGIFRKILHRINIPIIERIGTDFFACSKEAGSWLFPDMVEQLRIIPDAINIEEFRFSQQNRMAVRRSLHLTEKSYVLGHVGRFDEQKNHAFLVAVFSQFHRSHPDSFLLLIGEGQLMGVIRKRVQELNLTENVIFVGKSENVSKYYCAMDIFLLPSLFEGFGMVALEAQSSGLNCLVSSSVSKEVNVTGKVRYLALDNFDIWLKELNFYFQNRFLLPKDRSEDNMLCKKSRYSLENAHKQLIYLLNSDKIMNTI